MTPIAHNSSLLRADRPAPASHRSRDVGIHVLLADDYRASSYHVWALLTAQSDVRAVSTGESVEEVLSLLRQHPTDLCMISATFELGEGLRLTHRLKRLSPAPAVLLYANALDTRLAGAAMIAGADGVFDPQTGADALANMLWRLAAGEQLFPALVPDPFPALAACVDDADRRIVAMLLARTDPDEIARLLGISARSFRERHQVIVGRLEAAYPSERVAPGEIPRPRPVFDDGPPTSWVSGSSLRAGVRGGRQRLSRFRVAGQDSVPLKA